LQLTPQVLDTHVGLPLAGAGHTLPHAPQFSRLVDVFTHAPPHERKPVSHTMAQMPA